MAQKAIRYFQFRKFSFVATMILIFEPVPQKQVSFNCGVMSKVNKAFQQIFYQNLCSNAEIKTPRFCSSPGLYTYLYCWETPLLPKSTRCHNFFKPWISYVTMSNRITVTFPGFASAICNRLLSKQKLRFITCSGNMQGLSFYKLKDFLINKKVFHNNIFHLKQSLQLIFYPSIIYLVY